MRLSLGSIKLHLVKTMMFLAMDRLLFWKPQGIPRAIQCCRLTCLKADLSCLPGDLYHRTESRESQLVPRFNTDESETRESMTDFERLAKELGARVIIQHEPTDVSALPQPPGFLQ